jgi:Ca-activated chloride channel family protein
VLVLAAAAALLIWDIHPTGQEPEPRFRGGVDLVNVTATVTDETGRFVAGLSQGDFTVYEDDRRVDVTHFSAERVPVSLGIVLDTSGSMAGERIAYARGAIERFLDQLNGGDEVFLSSFSNLVSLVQPWTADLDTVRARLRDLSVFGGTAMYDAVADAVPMVQQGRHRKKALVLISDGNDTASWADLGDVRRTVRETEVLVYAVGIEEQERATGRRRSRRPRNPFPFPGRGGSGSPFLLLSQYPRAAARHWNAERLNVTALREITDDSGGRTEVVLEAGDLDRATSSIADELSRQYYLGYVSTAPRDGQWHTIRVDVADRSLRIRARRGYVAS